MNKFKVFFSEKLSTLQSVGFWLLLIELALYGAILMGVDQQTKLLCFATNFLAAVMYFLAILSQSYKKGFGVKWLNYDPLAMALAVNIFLVSAFSLNSLIEVFAPFPWWLTLLLLTSQLALIVAPYNKDNHPFLLDQFISFFLILGLFLNGYMALFLVQIYPMAITMFLALGISSHAFAPLIIFITMLIIWIKGLRERRYGMTSVRIGIAIPILVITLFALKWSFTTNDLNNVKNQLQGANPDLPVWTKLDQRINKNPWVTKYLKFQRDLSSNNRRTLIRGASLPLHNPLVIISYFFSGELKVQQEQINRWLKTHYGSRHEFHRKLWSGEDLKTKSIQTNIEVFPRFRLAYFQKTFTIENTSGIASDQQEALYTFHLPDGAMATSLSLWVKGEERKARLTTREKADESYSTIVGTEKRDPALMHWHQGNQVSVTVFPCTPENSRKFKVGFTVPLRYHNEALYLDQIYFQGPDPKQAKTQTSLNFPQYNIDEKYLPQGFEKQKKGTYQQASNFRGNRTIKFPAPELAEAPFTFNGYQYKTHPASPVKKDFKPQAIFLDINESWTQEEFEAIWEKIKSYDVYVPYQGKLVAMNANNRYDLFEHRLGLRYSLFPIHLIPNPEKSLLITKSFNLSPIPENLEGSGLYKDLKNYWSGHPKLPVFDLGNHLTPFLKTFKAFGDFHYQKGHLNDLSAILTENYFPEYPEKDSVVHIPRAGMRITKKEAGNENPENQAPDHLMRLYGYRKALHNKQGNPLAIQQVPDEALKWAKATNVVTPFSSLVTLETDEDYERFEIEKQDKQKSVGNADLLDSDDDGAVPEPDEWALIIFGGLFLLMLMLRRMGFSVFPW